MLIVRSPVRISFGGGGTDLPGYYSRFGGAVLSTSINKYFYTILQKRTDGKIQVISSDLRVMETWHDISQMELKQSELAIPLAALQEIGQDISVDLFLASEIAAGSGLGSSASVCVGVLKTLATYLDLPLSKYELAEQAFHIARNVLGKPVGKQDEYAAAFGGLNFITFHPDGSTSVQPVDLSLAELRELESNLMLFFTGVAHDSWSLLREHEGSTKSNAGLALESLHQVRRLADEMRITLLERDFRSLGVLLHEGWQAKKKVSSLVSTPFIDESYALARENGALGGKIAGAGGGGFLLLFCEQENQARVRDAMARAGLKEMAFGLDFQGAGVITNDPFIDSDEKCGTSWTFAPAFTL
jgi:D-glycero-alpha-D-manno-heptose-7-phosphate kinase